MITLTKEQRDYWIAYYYSSEEELDRDIDDYIITNMLDIAKTNIDRDDIVNHFVIGAIVVNDAKRFEAMDEWRDWNG